MLRILHLSDVHFGADPKTGACVHHFQNGGVPDPDGLARVLQNDESLSSPPDVIVLSGDIGWSGCVDDYTHALAFVEKLKARWCAAAIILAPGNHDVLQGTEKDAAQRAYADFVAKVHGPNLSECYPLWSSNQLSERERLIQITSVGDPKRRDALFVSVNSAAYLSIKLPILIDEQVLQRIDERIATLAGGLRVFVLHHHILPFVEITPGAVSDRLLQYESADPTIVANSARLQTWLASRGFYAVLHGHRHHFHGREDRLHHSETKGHRVLIIGASSAGVHQGHRSPEPLGYNVIEAHRAADSTWRVDVEVRRILEKSGVHQAASHVVWTADAGEVPVDHPAVFAADYSDECHALIRRATKTKQSLDSFVSIVRVADYRHPPTATIGMSPATESEVRRSFLALHPEWERSKGWTERGALRPSLQERTPRVQFQHGPRLLSVPASGPQTEPVKDEHRPIVQALHRLKHGSASNAYVSLFRPETDVLVSPTEPLPALQSIQFIRRDDVLDLVATFRKLELSFWWVVNIYEAINILKWAVLEAECKTAGRITFFAPLAVWKDNPERTVLSELDQLPLGNTVDLASRVVQRDSASITELTRLLNQKRMETNKKNVVPGGLQQLAHVLGGLLAGAKTPDPGLKDLHEHLTRAATLLEQELRPRDGDSSSIPGALGALENAVTALDALGVALA